MTDAKYISDTIIKINNLKESFKLKFNNICDVLDKMDTLKNVKVTLDYDSLLEAIADFYYYNASYDACETYSDIESFMDALRENEMEELSKKYSKDRKNFEIGCMVYADFEYRTALGWHPRAFDDKVLNILNDYVTAVNPKMFELSSNVSGITDFDAFALYLFYKDAYADVCNKMDAVLNRAEEVKSSIEHYLDMSEKYNEKSITKLAFIKAIKDNDVLNILNEIILLKGE